MRTGKYLLIYQSVPDTCYENISMYITWTISNLRLTAIELFHSLPGGRAHVFSGVSLSL